MTSTYFPHIGLVQILKDPEDILINTEIMLKCAKLEMENAILKR